MKFRLAIFDDKGTEIASRQRDLSSCKTPADMNGAEYMFGLLAHELFRDAVLADGEWRYAGLGRYEKCL